MASRVLSLKLPDQIALLDEIKALSYRQSPLMENAYVVILGFATADGKLTLRGKQVEEACFILGKPELAQPLFDSAYASLPVPQIILQSFRGKGDVPVAGILHVLIKHGVDETPSSLRECRVLLEELNKRKLLVYNRKAQTARVNSSDTDVVAMDMTPAVRIINPDRPFSNLMHLREIVRECREYLYWADPHLTRKVLEILADEQDAAKIQAIRLLSGPAQIDRRTLTDFKRFAAEALSLGIVAEWRVHESGRDWHDRYIVSGAGAWNIPPINSLLKGDYSEAWPTPSNPPFDSWWNSATELAKFVESQSASAKHLPTGESTQPKVGDSANGKRTHAPR